MPTATCDQCSWRVEADDRYDARQAAADHFDDAHAPYWCKFCQSEGPMAKRRDHQSCQDEALRLEAEYLDG